MSTTNGERSRVTAALVLPTVFAELLEDRRVLYVGSGDAEDHERLAARCRALRVLDTGEGGRRRARAYRSSPYRPGPLGFQPGAFDVAIVPEVAELGDEARERLLDLARIVDGGPVLVGTDPETGVGYDTLYGWLEGMFENVRIFGEAPFVGVAVGDFEAGDQPDVVLDASLVSEETAPRAFFAVASDSPLRLASYTVVRVPAPEAAHEAPRGARPPTRDESEARARLAKTLSEVEARAESAVKRGRALEEEVARLSDEVVDRDEALEAARRDARDLAKRLAAAEREVEKARDRTDPEAAREHEILEARLVERAKKIRELEAEVERRGQLVRDAVEESRELRRAGRGEPDAVERAVAAEVARAEAQFHVDELRSRLRELEDSKEQLEIALQRAREARRSEPSAAPSSSFPADVARLEGMVAGLRLRLANAERAFAAKSVAARRGEAALDTVDELRAEIAAHKAENGALTIEVVDLRAEVRDLRARTGDATSALAGRDALVTRLQLELSDVEQRLRNSELRAARLADESSSLRAAIVEAATLSDARDKSAQDNETLRTQLAELRDRARRLEADRFELEERVERSETARSTLEERLSAAERERAELSEKAGRLEREHAALADEVLALATELAQADERRRAGEEGPASGGSSEQAERIEAELELLRSHAEAVAKERDDARAILAETRETLESLRSQGSELPAATAATPELERELRDRDVLLRSLTAQLEERNDRIRALERRLSGSIPAGPADDELRKQQLLELEERATRLADEVAAEREARRIAESRLESLVRKPDVSIEVGRLRDELGRSQRDLDMERGRAEGFERDVRSLREVCVEARQNLESLLGSATTSGDQEAADRIGQLLTILGRY